MRALTLFHRYLGVVVGALVALWCLSGFVMMYMPYPGLDDAERLRGLAPIQASHCCRNPVELQDPDLVLADWDIQMRASKPVLRAVPIRSRPSELRGPTSFDLATGATLVPVEAEAGLQIAHGFAARQGIDSAPRLLRTIDYDQWTLQGARRRAPLLQFALDDDHATELYVSSRDGEVVQWTTRRQRVLNWFGAIPHWLYPTILRANGALWTQVVIWGSVIGGFLTVAGLWLGIDHWRRRRIGRISPFRGLWEWHHVAGLFFGLVLLSWLVSGLFSMNPWGSFEGSSGPAERKALAGEVAWQRYAAALPVALPAILARLPDVVQIGPAPLADEGYLLATTASGARRRFDLSGREHPLSTAELALAVKRLPAPMQSPVLLTEGDDYYYSHNSDRVPLPVWRVELEGPEPVQVYIDPVTGEVARAVDSPQRGYRWWFAGLHRLDFAVLRHRPLWDAIVLILLAGVSVLSVSGVWLAFRRVRRDLTGLWSRH